MSGRRLTIDEAIAQDERRLERIEELAGELMTATAGTPQSGNVKTRVDAILFLTRKIVVEANADRARWQKGWEYIGGLREDME